ncbi:MAG TPA: MFS transporter [Nevskiaceae bacterium]|nr:MFS transporter [Nevskiaceae bacterium]
MRGDLREFRSGWPILLAALFGNFSATYSLLYFGLSSFMKPLQAEFGWGRPAIGLAVVFMTLAVVVVSPWVGKACDHYGSRRVVLVSVPLSVLAIAGLSQIGASIWQFYLGYLLAILAGAGTLGLAYTGSITPHFDRHRGLALGLAFAGAGFTAVLMPLLLAPLIERWGWRNAFLALALLPLLQWPLAWWLLPRDRAAGQATSAGSTRPLTGFSFQAAVRQPRFWILGTTFFLLGLTLAGLVVNLRALLEDRGLTVETAGRVTSTLGIGIIAARVLAGWLVDRWHAPVVGALGFSGAAIGCALLFSADPLLAGLGTLLLGIAIGSEMDLLAYMTTRYFGLAHQTQIVGAIFSVFTFGGICSPALIGALYARSHDYDGALAVGILACSCAALLILRMGPYPAFGAGASSRR